MPTLNPLSKNPFIRADETREYAQHMRMLGVSGKAGPHWPENMTHWQSPGAEGAEETQGHHNKQTSRGLSLANA